MLRCSFLVPFRFAFMPRPSTSRQDVHPTPSLVDVRPPAASATDRQSRSFFLLVVPIERCKLPAVTHASCAVSLMHQPYLCVRPLHPRSRKSAPSQHFFPSFQ